MPSAVRRSLPLALTGFVAGASAGLLAAPDVLAVPGLFAVSGFALGLLTGLLVEWRRAPQHADLSPPTAHRHVAVTSPPWPLAPPPPGGDPAPGWYPDPRHSGARRYWDGDFWTEHLWLERERARPRRILR
jgi:hypothetical protein